MQFRMQVDINSVTEYQLWLLTYNLSKRIWRLAHLIQNHIYNEKITFQWHIKIKDIPNTKYKITHIIHITTDTHIHEIGSLLNLQHFSLKYVKLNLDHELIWIVLWGMRCIIPLCLHDIYSDSGHFLADIFDLQKILKF